MPVSQLPFLCCAISRAAKPDFIENPSPSHKQAPRHIWGKGGKKRGAHDQGKVPTHRNKKRQRAIDSDTFLAKQGEARRGVDSPRSDGRSCSCGCVRELGSLACCHLEDPTDC
jgi:hypothetical protein